MENQNIPQNDAQNHSQQVPPPVSAQQPQVVYVQAPAPRMPRRTNHALHFVLSLITFGMWVPVWIGVAIYTAAMNNATR